MVSVLQFEQCTHWLCKFHAISKLISAFLFLIMVLLYSVQQEIQLIWLFLWTLALLALTLSLNPSLNKIVFQAALMFLLLSLPLLTKGSGTEDSLLVQMGAIRVFKNAALIFTATFLKAMLVLIVFLIVFVSTPYSQLLQTLQYLKVPGWALAVLMYTFRLLILMQQEAMRIKRAIKARGRVTGLKRKIRFAINFSGLYLARLMERSDWQFKAMMSRGFKGQVFFLDAQPINRNDVVLIVMPVVFSFGFWL